MQHMVFLWFSSFMHWNRRTQLHHDFFSRLAHKTLFSEKWISRQGIFSYAWGNLAMECRRKVNKERIEAISKRKDSGRILWIFKTRSLLGSYIFCDCSTLASVSDVRFRWINNWVYWLTPIYSNCIACKTLSIGNTNALTLSPIAFNIQQLHSFQYGVWCTKMWVWCKNGYEYVMSIRMKCENRSNQLMEKERLNFGYVQVNEWATMKTTPVNCDRCRT